MIEGKRFAWQRGDTVVVPTWNRYEHRALADSVLFSLSDEPLMRFAKYYRVEAD
jgi:gentisate 1,2-dioxygenase